MSRRTQIVMSADEVRAFLDEQTKVQIATVGKDGAPHLSTLFYSLLDGKIAFTTYKASQKVVNLRRNPTMTCLVDAGEAYDQLRGVVLYGKGDIIEDHDTLLQVAAVVGARMTGLPAPDPSVPLDEASRELLEKTVAKRVVVVMEPDRVVSWDHRKLSTTHD